MQKWEYVTMQAQWSGEDKDRVFYVLYITVEGARKEKPEPIAYQQKPLLGKVETYRRSPTNEECWSWFYGKIAQLGQDGWEMISAPNSVILGSGAGCSWTGAYLLWFKRPAA